MINTDKFTQKAADIIQGAIDEASSLGHTYVGSEHIVLSISADGTSEAAQILMDGGVSYDELRQEVISLVGQGSPSMLNQRYFTTAAKRILENSCKAAVTEKKDFADTEHILASVISEASCSACTVIKKAS